jgi:spore coat protein U-like protein
MRSIVKLLALALMLWLAAAPARAQTCSATVSSVDFGSPELLAGGTFDAMATLTVSCTQMALLTVVKMCPGIGAGSGGSSGASRLLKNGTNSLTYQLYQDSGYSQGWGSLSETQLGTVPAIILSGGLSGAATATRTIYARLFADPAAPAGTYLSSFTGGQTTFSYASALLGASTNCTGFTGSAVVRPEFTVRATPLPTCAITATDLDFGVAGVLSSAINGQSSLRITCSPGASWSVTMDGGQTGTVASRRMTTTGGDVVSYNLYRDAGRSLVWGSTTNAQASGTGTGATQTLPVYGRVPAQSTPRAGAYSDRIVATINY